MRNTQADNELGDVVRNAECMRRTRNVFLERTSGGTFDVGKRLPFCARPMVRAIDAHTNEIVAVAETVEALDGFVYKQLCKVIGQRINARL